MRSEDARTLTLPIAKALIAALVVFILLLFLWEVHAVVLMLFLGIIFGVTLSAGAAWLRHRFGLKRSLGAVLIVLLIFGVIAGIGAIVAPSVSKQVTQLQKDLPSAIDRFEDVLRGRTVAGVPIAPPDLSSTRIMRRIFSSNSAPLVKMLFPFLTNSVAALGGVVVIIFLAIYIAAEPKVYKQGFIRLFPPKRRKTVEDLFDELGPLIRQWLVARVLAMLAIGIVTALALWAAGIPAFAALGVIAGLLEFVPFFGPIVSAIPAIAMGLMVSPTKALVVIAIFLVIQQLEGNVITPLLLRNRVDVPPLITIVAVTALGVVFGVVGMLIAEPLSAIVIATIRKLHVERMEAAAGVPRSSSGSSEFLGEES